MIYLSYFVFVVITLYTKKGGHCFFICKSDECLEMCIRDRGQVSDTIRQIYLTEETNCAEALFRAALASRGKELPQECYRMMSGYSGGVSSEKLCGAILGGVAAVSALINQGDEESFEASKEASAEFLSLIHI